VSVFEGGCAYFFLLTFFGLLFLLLLCLVVQEPDAVPDQQDNPSRRVDAEIALYRAVPFVPGATDPLVWWKANESRFPTIAILAKKYLAIPASSAPSERVFSQTKAVVEKKNRWRLLPEKVEQLVFLQYNKKLNKESK